MSKQRVAGHQRESNSSDIEALREAEAAYLEVARADPHSAFFKASASSGAAPHQGDAPDPAVRRRFLAGSAALATLPTMTRSAGGAAPPGAVEQDVPADPSKALGYPMADESYGSRSQFETEVRT